jgi:hypothetical protein
LTHSVATVINIAVFVTLALGVGFEAEWAYSSFTAGIYYWPLAVINFVLLGFVLGRVIWDWVYPPS